MHNNKIGHIDVVRVKPSSSTRGKKYWLARMVRYPEPRIQSNWNNVPFAVFGSKICSKPRDTEEKNCSYAWGFWRVDTLWFIDHSEQLGCQDWPALSSVCVRTLRAFWHVQLCRGTEGGEILPLLLSFSYPFSHTGLGHWSVLLGGFLGMLRDILTRKCLTFLITQASSIPRESLNEKWFNLFLQAMSKT